MANLVQVALEARQLLRDVGARSEVRHLLRQAPAVHFRAAGKIANAAFQPLLVVLRRLLRKVGDGAAQCFQARQPRQQVAFQRLAFAGAHFVQLLQRLRHRALQHLADALEFFRRHLAVAGRDQAGNAQQGHQVGFRRGAEFLLQRLVSLQVRRQELAVNFEFGGPRAGESHRDFHVAARNVFLQQAAHDGFQRFQAGGQTQLGIEKAMVGGADAHREGEPRLFRFHPAVTCHAANHVSSQSVSYQLSVRLRQADLCTCDSQSPSLSMLHLVLVSKSLSQLSPALTAPHPRTANRAGAGKCLRD